MKTKEQLLWDKLMFLGIFNSHQVREIGFSMFYDRCDRTVRAWAELKKIRRIPTEECFMRGLIKEGNSRLAWWEKIN